MQRDGASVAVIWRIHASCIDPTLEELTQKVVCGPTKMTLGRYDWVAARSGTDAEISPSRGPRACHGLSKATKTCNATRSIPPPQIQMNWLWKTPPAFYFLT